MYVYSNISKRPNIEVNNLPSNFELFKTYLKLFLLHKTDFLFKYKENNLFYVQDFLGFEKLYFDNIIPIRCLFNEIYLNNSYYFVTDKDDPFIIDCGSNRGISVLFFKRIYPNSKILAFEPYKRTFNILSKNIEFNKIKNVKLINKAVSNEIGKIKFYIADETIEKSFNFVKGQENISSYYVSSTLLSKYIHKEVDLLKLDIESSELKVIKDLNDTNKLRLIKEIVMEYHYTPNLSGNKLSKLMKILEKNNFSYQIGDGFIDSTKKDFPTCFCILHAYRMDN